MTIPNRTMLARRKLLKLLPREVLEQLSNLDQPWHASRRDLETHAAERWDEQEVLTHIYTIFAQARESKP